MGSIGRLGRCRVPASRARGSENKVGGGQIDAGGGEKSSPRCERGMLCSLPFTVSFFAFLFFLNDIVHCFDIKKQKNKNTENYLGSHSDAFLS